MKRYFVGLILSVLVFQPMAVGNLALAQQASSLGADDQSVTTDQSSVDLKQEIDALNHQVTDQQAALKRLESTLGRYQTQIAAQEQAKLSLVNELSILDNRVKENQLAIERAKSQIEMTNLEIRALSDQIELDQAVIVRRQQALAEIVRRIQEGDQVTVMDAFLTRPSLSELFARLEEMKRVEEDLSDATQRVKDGKAKLEATKKDQEAHRLALQDQKLQLQNDQKTLELNRAAKLAMVDQTQNRQQEFERIVFELRQQRQTESDEISNLQDRLKDKLDSADAELARGDVLLQWPISTDKGITARFHDPSYPFRNLFEHPGIDIATDVGTPIHAAAGGYVAWTRTGKQYGNYIMIIHSGGLATVYGHLSKFLAKGDSYVVRGDIIGYSGGLPGMQGAGLSTGPHLHFEVRQNGIPVNPENFLPSLD